MGGRAQEEEGLLAPKLKPFTALWVWDVLIGENRINFPQSWNVRCTNDTYLRTGPSQIFMS